MSQQHQRVEKRRRRERRIKRLKAKAIIAATTRTKS